MIDGLHHAQVGIPPGGLAVAHQFYCELLGLEEVPRPFGPNGFWVRVGDRIVHFGIDEVADRTISRAHVAYRVSDLPEMRRRLEQAGYSIDDPEKMPGHERFQIHDPFGNLVEFIELTPEMGTEPSDESGVRFV